TRDSLEGRLLHNIRYYLLKCLWEPTQGMNSSVVRERPEMVRQFANTSFQARCNPECRTECTLAFPPLLFGFFGYCKRFSARKRRQALIRSTEKNMMRRGDPITCGVMRCKRRTVAPPGESNTLDGSIDALASKPACGIRASGSSAESNRERGTHKGKG